MQKNRAKRRRSKRQQVWEYMRRNAIFSVTDIEILIKISRVTLKRMMRQLESEGYVKQVSGGYRWKGRVYKLITNSGVICPRWDNAAGMLIDPNIRKTKLHSGAMKLPIEDNSHTPLKKISPDAYAKGRLLRILQDASAPITLTALAERSGVPAAQFATALHKLKADGEVLEVGKQSGVPLLQLADEAVAS